MKMKKWLTSAVMVLFLAGSTAAFADLQLVERSTETEGDTTITWDSSFEDLNYTVGNEITLRVNWDVNAGFATFNGVALRGPSFTPKGPDAATGELVRFGLIKNSNEAEPSGIIDVTIRFDSLHCAEDEGVAVGNAHFWLLLDVLEDTDEGTLEPVGYGVNVHVEQRGECVPVQGGPPAEIGRPVNAGPPPGIPPIRPVSVGNEEEEEEENEEADDGPPAFIGQGRPQQAGPPAGVGARRR